MKHHFRIQKRFHKGTLHMEFGGVSKSRVADVGNKKVHKVKKN